MQRLMAAAEMAKRELSEKSSTSMSIVNEGERQTLELTEAKLEQACSHLLKRLRSPVERALRDANLRSSMLDNVVLAGGATRMPVVRRLVTTMFGRFPAIEFNPDEVVALGAAVQAGLKAKDAALSEVVMTDVAPYSLGVAVTRGLSEATRSAGHFDPIIERNSTVPISRVKNYRAATQNQFFLDLNIFQGESRMVHDNIHLGDLRVEIPGGAIEDSSVDVRFTYDVNGLLQVEATVLKTQKRFSLLIEGNPGLMTEDEIAKRVLSLAELKIHPRDSLENRTVLAQAERHFQQLRSDAREWLGVQIMEFDKALATQDLRVVTTARKRLEEQLAHIERSGVLHDDT
jgi:molecular chaperone HscC